MSACVMGTGPRCKKTGYFRRRVNGVFIRQHRRVWEEAHGPLGDDMVVHHKCENPGCVNLEHLQAMTRAEHVKVHAKGVCKRGHDLTLPGAQRGHKGYTCVRCSIAWERARRRTPEYKAWYAEYCSRPEIHERRKRLARERYQAKKAAQHAHV